MRVEIITIGNEVLEGRQIDSNANFLSRELALKGYEIARQTVLPDDPDSLFHGLKESLGRSTLVIAAGGLGPTIDDLTKQVASRLFRAPLQIDSNLYDELNRRYGDTVSQEMAKVPKNAILIPNLIGTSPGFLFLSTEGSLLLLPAAPREMEQMFYSKAAALLAEHFPVFSKIQTTTISLCQLGAKEIDPILREIRSAHPDAKIGIYPSLGTLQVQFGVARDFDRLDRWASMIRKAYPTYLFDGPSIQDSVHHWLIQHGKTLALAESCTGGALCARLVAIPDASKFLLGSIVAYSNEWKENFLHVRHHTIEKESPYSLEAVREMAQGLIQHTKADYSIAVSGIVGPSGGTEKTPVGTIFVGIGERDHGIDAGKIIAPPHRASAVEYAIQFALGALWRRVAYQALTFV